MIFLKRETTNTENQLTSDFGEYPPKPLRSMMFNHQFDVVRFGWIGKQVYYVQEVVSLTYQLLTGGYRDTFSALPQKVQEHFRLTLQNCFKIKEILSQLKGEIKDLAIYEKIFLYLILVVISPIFFLIVLYKSRGLWIKLFRVFNIVLKCRKSIIGSYNTLSVGPLSIAVYNPIFRRTNFSIEAVISHEHIHFLQHKYFPERVSKDFDGQKEIVLKNLILNPENYEKLSYYFELNEMEARLHEVILSYYREHGELPSNYDGFIWLLSGCVKLVQTSFKPLSLPETILINDLLELIIEIEKKGGNLSLFASCEFKARNMATVEDMLISIINLKDIKTSLRFMLEVLPVMYGNLLIMYGDTNQAKKYFETVNDYELYKELYGEISVPRT